MAFTHTLVNRLCPEDSFPYLEEVMASCVGEVFYGEPDPDKASVDVTTAHARLSGGRFMSLNILIDTEDQPDWEEPDWDITECGLVVPPGAQSDSKPIDTVSSDGLKLYRHQLFQGRQLYRIVTAHPMWESGEIGWPTDKDPASKLKVEIGKKDPALKLGVLVAKIEGAWVDADNADAEKSPATT